MQGCFCHSSIFLFFLNFCFCLLLDNFTQYIFYHIFTTSLTFIIATIQLPVFFFFKHTHTYTDIRTNTNTHKATKPYWSSIDCSTITESREGSGMKLIYSVFLHQRKLIFCCCYLHSYHLWTASWPGVRLSTHVVSSVLGFILARACTHLVYAESFSYIWYIIYILDFAYDI